MVEPDMQDWSVEEKAEFEKAAIEGFIPAPGMGEGQASRSGIRISCRHRRPAINPAEDRRA
jgi:hypothetical protein